MVIGSTSIVIVGPIYHTSSTTYKSKLFYQQYFVTSRKHLILLKRILFHKFSAPYMCRPRPISHLKSIVVLLNNYMYDLTLAPYYLQILNLWSKRH